MRLTPSFNKRKTHIYNQSPIGKTPLGRENPTDHIPTCFDDLPDAKDKTTYATYHHSTVNLSQNLYRQLEKIFKGRDQDLNLAYTLFKKTFLKDGIADTFLDIPSTYFKHVIGYNYFNVLKPLMDFGILIRSDKYIPGPKNAKLGVCYKFLLNPIYTSRRYGKNGCRTNRPIRVSFKKRITPLRDRDKILETQQANDEETKSVLHQILHQDELTEKQLYFQTYRLGIDRQAAKATIKHSIEKIVRSSIIPYSNMPKADKIKLEYDGRLITNIRGMTMSTEDAYDLACEHRVDFFMYKNQYFLKPLKKFIQDEILTKKMAWLNSIDEIQECRFRASRNATNLRLDTNITNLPSELRKFLYFIGADGTKQRFHNLDIKSSQLQILTHLIQNPDKVQNMLETIYDTNIVCNDYTVIRNELIDSERVEEYRYRQRLSSKIQSTDSEELREKLYYVSDFLTHNIPPIELNFISDVQNGDIYQKLAHRLGTSNRNYGKKSMFTVLFSSPYYHNDAKEAFRQEYPRTFDWINRFKRTLGGPEFPIFLQIVETCLVVDIGFKALCEANIPSMTIHDSFLIPESYLGKAYGVIHDAWAEWGFYGQMKDEYLHPNI